ncbi:MAG: transcriptional repressor NrdR [Kiritimatiellae bacterium]|nr:transcriptional repressor NrdR [Kiritimatiellia bacterium]
MRCPKCGCQDDRVLDSRSAREGASIRRRRQCLACDFRFTTFEEIVKEELRVIKRDGRREEFSRSKLERGVRRAAEKRPISDDQIRDLIDRVVMHFDGESEVTADDIGRAVMTLLHDVDEVAYIRFASVYQRFDNADQFVRTIRELGGKGKR